LTLKVISLYLFSLQGIVLWGEYPTYSACVADKHYFDGEFAEQKETRLFAAECVELGKTAEEFLKYEEEE
jgi:hypothetical protein|tara:strand:+ start:989 stop:1198 length:210 start_codon:yes stop_codon:yes gene_type:complete